MNSLTWGIFCGWNTNDTMITRDNVTEVTLKVSFHVRSVWHDIVLPLEELQLQKWLQERSEFFVLELDSTKSVITVQPHFIRNLIEALQMWRLFGNLWAMSACVRASRIRTQHTYHHLTCYTNDSRWNCTAWRVMLTEDGSVPPTVQLNECLCKG